jgi:hypothetical protein
MRDKASRRVYPGGMNPAGTSPAARQDIRWTQQKRKRGFIMGIAGILVLVIILVYFVLPAAGEGRGGRYSPRHGWGGPSLVSLLVLILIILLIFKVIPVVW